MRVWRFALLLLLFFALPLLARDAPTISSISPSSLYAMSGEWFITIQGTKYLPSAGVSVIFSGPAGTISILPNTATDTNMETWVPLDVLNAPGYYSVTVRVPNGSGTLDSNAATLRIVGTSVILQVPNLVFAEALTLQGSPVRFSVTATSLFSDVTYVQCSSASGDTFAIGRTNVDCVATDDFGGVDRASFTVQVADTTPPAINVPTDPTVFGSADGSVFNYNATATDVVDPNVSAVCSPASGSFFRLGTSPVTCTSSDRFQNTSTVIFRVHVGSAAVPALIVPNTIVAEAASRSGATVTYAATATDSRGGGVAVRCDPPSGWTFPIGTTSVRCVAGQASDGFSVVVQDTTAPQLSLPRGVTVQAPAPDGATVTYDASASDAVDGSVPVSCYPASGSFFAPGTTSVTCTASDSSRNQATGGFVVTVLQYIDNTIYSAPNPPSKQ